MYYEVNYLYNTYLSFEGNSKPSKVQVILGVGLPEAEHFRETNGPGCNVWSMNEYDNVGKVSVKKKQSKINKWKCCAAL